MPETNQPREDAWRPAPPSEAEFAGVPVEEEQAEEQAPRRAASAEFIVESEAGSQVLLREAMDPANQSLREALRLSFRVLQLVMLILVVLFVISGFQKVDVGQSGVMLAWGKIEPVGGSAALEPGLKFSKWPYPIGDFVLFQEEHRNVDLAGTFWPDIPEGQTFERAVETANTGQHLKPGKDGYLLTRDGDIAHMKLSADYAVDSPVSFVHCVENSHPDPRRLDADKLVTLALERAAVHALARMSLTEVVDFADEDKQELQRAAQVMLAEVQAGIRVAQVSLPSDPTPALAIRKAYGDLQQAKSDSEKMIEDARQEAEKTLLSAAGADYQAILDLIAQYEDALDLNRNDEAERLLAAINDRLESEESAGEVSKIINYAKTYRSTVELTLGTEARRFKSILPAYRRSPRQVVARLWTETYSTVLARNDVEPFIVPADVGTIRLSINGYDEVRETRRSNALKTKERSAMTRGLNLDIPYIPRASEIRLKGPGRQLTPEAKGLRESK